MKSVDAIQEVEILPRVKLSQQPSSGTRRPEADGIETNSLDAKPHTTPAD